MRKNNHKTCFISDNTAVSVQQLSKEFEQIKRSLIFRARYDGISSMHTLPIYGADRFLKHIIFLLFVIIALTMVTCLICKRGELVHVYFHFDTLDYINLDTFCNCHFDMLDYINLDTLCNCHFDMLDYINLDTFCNFNLDTLD